MRLLMACVAVAHLLRCASAAAAAVDLVPVPARRQDQEWDRNQNRAVIAVPHQQQRQQNRPEEQQQGRYYSREQQQQLRPKEQQKRKQRRAQQPGQSQEQGLQQMGAKQKGQQMGQQKRKRVGVRRRARPPRSGEKAPVFRGTTPAPAGHAKQQQIVVEDHRRPPKSGDEEEEEEYEEVVYYEEYEDTPAPFSPPPPSPASPHASLALAPPPAVPTEAATSDTEIINTLLNRGYDWRVRPPGTNLSIPGSHGPVVVSVNMLIRSISKIDDVNMEYSVQMTFRESWVDGRLAYGLPRDGKPDFIILTAGQQIWMPDSFFQNEKQAQKHMIDKPNVLIRVHKDGLILYSVRISLVLSCPMHLQYYPMDVQTCLIDLASYAYTSDDIEYQWKAEKPIQLKDGLESSLPSFQLGLVNTTYCTSRTTTGSYSCLRTVLPLRRQFSYYLLQFYIPSTMLVIVSWVSFWLDRTAVPARVTLGVTTLLTMTTQASGINAKLPPVSYSKAIDIWCGACLTFIFSALLEFACVTYISSRMFYKSKKSSAFQGFASMGANASALGGALTLAPPRMASIVSAATINNNNYNNKEDDNNSRYGRRVESSSAALYSPNSAFGETPTIFQRRNPTRSEPLILPNYDAINKDRSASHMNGLDSGEKTAAATGEEDVWIRRSPPPSSAHSLAGVIVAEEPMASIATPGGYGGGGGSSLRATNSTSVLNSPQSAAGSPTHCNTSAAAVTYCNTAAEFANYGTTGAAVAAARISPEKPSPPGVDGEKAKLFQKQRRFTTASVAYKRRASAMLNGSRGWLGDTFLCRWLARQFDIEDRAKRADYISRVMFPVVFLIFNIVYWLRYSRYQITLPWS